MLIRVSRCQAPVNIVTIQFLVDIDTGRFEICYAGRDDEPIGYQELTYLLDAIYDSYQRELPTSKWEPESEKRPRHMLEPQTVSPSFTGEIKLQGKK